MKTLLLTVNRHQRLNKGFTLLELVVVIALIGILTAIGIVSFSTLGQQSRNNKRRGDIENIRQALEQYRSENDGYPSGANCAGLNKLKPDFVSTLPVDPDSGNCYTYAPSGCASVCSGYTITATLEPSGTYTQDQYSKNL